MAYFTVTYNMQERGLSTLFRHRIFTIDAKVIRNISTTELPKDHIETGFWFFDKVVHLYNGFLKNVFGIGPYQGSNIFFDTIR